MVHSHQPERQVMGIGSVEGRMYQHSTSKAKDGPNRTLSFTILMLTTDTRELEILLLTEEIITELVTNKHTIITVIFFDSNSIRGSLPF